MTTSELTSLLLQECRNIFSQVAEPQHFEGEGPFVIALDEEAGDSVFYFFVIVTAGDFLAAPEAWPRAFKNEDFFHIAADQLDMTKVQHTGKYFRLTLRKVAPDEPACRHTVQQIGQTDPESAARILLVGRDGVWHSGKTLSLNPDLPS